MNMLKHNVVDNSLSKMYLNPYCDHGPTVLFERILGSGETNRFYACSASRDRKICSFYLAEGKRKNCNKEEIYDKEQLQFKEHASKFIKFKKLSKFVEKKSIFFCETCNILYNNSKTEKHSSCAVHEIVSKTQLESPSQLVSPKSNSKFEAQYFFSEKSLEVIMKSIKDLTIEKVLCIGVPSIHEAIKNSVMETKSYLLDIDKRYCNFYSVEEFSLYNLFNHHFFCGNESKEVFKKFILGSEKMLLIIDPPFGGRMELISNTIKIIEKKWRELNSLPDDKILPVFFIFPYFLEKSVKAQLPSFSMLEYQVNYSNHGSYSKGPRGMKHGSAVRIFTNLSPQLFALPEDEGYKYCKQCKRWVHSQNVHCSKCGNCTSTDGRTYIHCNICNICVKPAWIHCQTCTRCLPKDHNCKSTSEKGNEDKNVTTSKNPLKRKREQTPSDSRKPKNKGIPLTLTEERNRNISILEQLFKK